MQESLIFDVKRLVSEDSNIECFTEIVKKLCFDKCFSVNAFNCGVL